MKRLLMILLAICMLGGSFSATALSSADNDILKIISPVSKARAFAEFCGDDTKYGFDVKGYVDLGNGKELIGSTFDGYGYHTFLNVNGHGGAMSGKLDGDNGDAFDLSAAISAMSYNCAGTAIQTIGGLNLKLENSFAGDGNIVKISYTINNPTDNALIFSLSTTADVQVNNDDEAELRVLPGGKGAKLVSADSNCVFTVDGSGTGLDKLWIGEWEDDYFVNMFEDSADNAVFKDGDSAICWSWTERIIAPAQTLSFYVLIEVGVNSAPAVSVEGDKAVFEDAINVTVSDPNLGAVDLHYIINNGEEQIIKEVSLTEGDAICPVSIEELVCGTSHSIKLWAVDDTLQSSDELVLVFEKAHSMDVPRVAVAPTTTDDGILEYRCTACDHKESKPLTFGNGNLDAGVNSIDAAFILKYDAFLETDFSPIQLMMCDVTGDGAVNSIDAAQVLKLDAFLVDSFENAVFSYEKYKELCLEYYGRYEYNDATEGNDEKLFGSFTGSDVTGKPKNYVFFEDGTGTVAIGDLVYDVKWSTRGTGISISKKEGDIDIYAEQATYTVVGDTLALTDETGTAAVYIKDKEGYESTDLIGTWTCYTPNLYPYIFTFEEDGFATLMFSDTVTENAAWSTDGDRLIIEDEDIDTSYKIINDKLFITVDGKLRMFIKDLPASGDLDTNLLGHWVNGNSEEKWQSLSFFEDETAVVVSDKANCGSFYAYDNTLKVAQLMYAKYEIEEDTLTLLHDSKVYTFEKTELGVGTEVEISNGKTNYAQDADYTVFADGAVATEDIYMPDAIDHWGDTTMHFWGDTALNKLTDGTTANTDKLNANGAQEAVTVIYKGNGKPIDIVIDLGESYEDIESISFLGVRNGENFGFDIFGTKLYICADNESWGNALTASFEMQPITEQNYNFSYSFSSAVSGRYIKISFPATENLIQFDEILVLN